jgi:hypothetical protein
VSRKRSYDWSGDRLRIHAALKTVSQSDQSPVEKTVIYCQRSTSLLQGMRPSQTCQLLTTPATRKFEPLRGSLTVIRSSTAVALYTSLWKRKHSVDAESALILIDLRLTLGNCQTTENSHQSGERRGFARQSLPSEPCSGWLK